MKHVLIVGCPRSGTSWLQLLLAQHPAIATTQETHLFNNYLSRLEKTWRRFPSVAPNVGMRRLLSEDEFYHLCADFAKAVFGRIADGNPNAQVVLEKTPDHVRYGPFILRLVPDIYFLHIVRDPRSVVSSLSAAAKSWARGQWASTNVVRNAQLWRSDVTLGRELRTLTPRYLEVRYEDLLGEQGPEQLVSLLAWLDLPADEDFARSAFAACQIDRLRAGGEGVRNFDALSRSQPNFFRKGQANGWKEDLSPSAIRVVEYITRDLMETYGYTLSSAPSRKPLRLVIDQAVSTVERRVRRHVDTAFEKLRAL
ncbi:MAG TPA: sulfotransferase [Vicinamibacterales bacterium]|jgi:hypothetical protein